MNNIASERRRIGMTQEEFAKRLGCCKTSLSLYEGGAAVSSDRLKKMADIFGCTTDYLLARTEERIG